MDDCIFCKIVAGSLPATKVLETNEYLAFLDIAPRTLGHSLLIPKKHYRWTYDVPHFGEYWEVALKLTQAMKKGLDIKYVAYIVFGTEVPHAHISIIPMYEYSEEVTERQKFPLGAMQETASKIITALK